MTLLFYCAAEDVKQDSTRATKIWSKNLATEHIWAGDDDDIDDDDDDYNDDDDDDDADADDVKGGD